MGGRIRGSLILDTDSNACNSTRAEGVLVRGVQSAGRAVTPACPERAYDRLKRDLVPWLIALAVMLAIAVVVAPWGNYPLNDDWQYARAARIFANQGRIVIDTPIAPSLVGQVVLAWPFIKIFGYNHVVLRLLTIAMAAVILWTLNEILVYARVDRHTRTKALLLVAVQPWFINLAMSFMTECYGYALALAGAVVWLRSRKSCDARYVDQVVTVLGALVAGLLVGASFWIRQFCVVTYPALVVATIYHVVATRSWQRLARSLVPIGTGMGACAGTVVAYFAWAKANHVLKSPFSGPLGQMSHFRLLDHQLVLGLQLFYLGAALLPLFATWPIKRRKFRRALVAGAVTLSFGLGLYTLTQLAAGDDAAATGLHRVFPFSSNIINSHGVGANTLSDVFFGNTDYFAVLPRRFWLVVGYVLLAATALWGLPLSALDRVRHMARSGREAFVFALAFTILSLLVVAQSSGVGFDRYYLPSLFGVTVCVAILFHGEGQFPRRHWRPWATILFAVVTLPLAFFVVGGLHDYFRWNDARWTLVARAMDLGIPSTSIDGGYEVNGELSFDLVRRTPEAIDQSACIGGCRCDIPYLRSIWTCYDDSYRVGVTARDGYKEVARIEPTFWLGRSRALILSRRPE
jgi:hypothetical protein